MCTSLMRRVVFVFVAAVCFVGWRGASAEDPNPPSIRSDRGAWPIRRQWTPAESRHYAEWMEHIYAMKTKGTVDQRIGKLERILTDPEMNLLLDPAFLGRESNPQLPIAVIRPVHSMLDCAKLTAFLPAYYAYRRALPWMSSYVAAKEGDVRNAEATIPVGFESSFTSPSAAAFFDAAVNGFNSGNYRVELNGRNAEWSDTVPVAITREFLLPGCVNYVDGHCLLLGKVSEYGELHFLNASTTPTRDIFTYNGMNVVSGITPRGSNPDNEWGGCFQGLRVIRYPIAETDSRGRVIRVRRRTDEEMKEFGFSTEQYLRVQEMYEKHEIDAGDIKPTSFHDFVRLRMKTLDSIPVRKYMEEYVDELLDVYKFREDFVQGAWRDVLANGPITYPEERDDENIFQALGRWEAWSSPSSDVDRRNKYFYLSDWMDYVLRWFGMKPEFIDLTGLGQYQIQSQADLARALIAEKNRLFPAKKMHYANSQGKPIELTLLEIEKRLYDLSFDPNHPPELRWGAPEGSAERATAPQRYTPAPDGAKIPMEEAYRLEAYYRTLGERETERTWLRGMFTSGYPIRDKLDAGVATRWFWVEKPTDAIATWLSKTQRVAQQQP